MTIVKVPRHETADGPPGQADESDGARPEMLAVGRFLARSKLTAIIREKVRHDSQAKTVHMTGHGKRAYVPILMRSSHSLAVQFFRVMH
jgi:hypothetical protein